MKRAVLAMALVTVSSGVASAGGYIGLGIGTGPAANADSQSFELDADGRSYRLLGGFRFGRFAIEGALGRFDMHADTAPFDVYQGQLSGKYNLPLDNNFSAFGRLGLHKLWFNNADGRSDADVSGTGLVVGAGFEYRFSTGLASGSLFVEYQYSQADLSGESFDWGSTSLRMWTLGATIGF